MDDKPDLPQPELPPEQPQPALTVRVPERLWPLAQLADMGAPVCNGIMHFIASEPDEAKRMQYLSEVWQLCQMVMEKAARLPTRKERRHHKKKR